MPSREARVRQIASWKMGRGFPADRPIVLRGWCDCGDEKHRSEIVITNQHGLLSGTFECDRSGSRRRLDGCFGESRGMFLEYGIDEAATGELKFEWRLVSGVLVLDGWRCAVGQREIDAFRVEGVVASPEERVIHEGCSNEVRFPIGNATMMLRRGCGRAMNESSHEVLSVVDGDSTIELARLDRIEWGNAGRHPEAEPASDGEVASGMPRSVFRVDSGGFMAIFDGWRHGATRSHPLVIAIPIRDGLTVASETRIFHGACVTVEAGIARIHEQDLRSGADPYRDEPQRPDVVWAWQGRSWGVMSR
jgi:hypothetical protein